MTVLAYVRKFLAAVLGNGAVVAELELIPNNDGRIVVMILTLIATTIGVYAVPNAGTAPVPPATR